MKRGIEFDTGDGAGKTLAQVLRIYADAAYPQGGSECTQATRASLQQLAQQIAETSARHENLMLSKRQLPLLRSAVEWYFSEILLDMDHVMNGLLERLK